MTSSSSMQDLVLPLGSHQQIILLGYLLHACSYSRDIRHYCSHRLYLHAFSKSVNWENMLQMLFTNASTCVRPMLYTELVMKSCSHQLHKQGSQMNSLNPNFWKGRWAFQFCCRLASLIINATHFLLNTNLVFNANFIKSVALPLLKCSNKPTVNQPSSWDWPVTQSSTACGKICQAWPVLRDLETSSACR